MTEKRLELGNRGEAVAMSFLKKKGYRILEQNFRTPAGEVDIVAEHEKAVVFVEVKTRASMQLGHPFTAITPAKQKKLVKMAKIFLTKHKINGRDCRFDVVSVIVAENEKDPQIELLQDAFRL